MPSACAPPAPHPPRRWRGVALVVLLGWVWVAPPAARAGVLADIERTGILVAGTRADSPPFAFKDAQGQFAGFSVDILKELTTTLSQRLKRTVVLQLKQVTPEDRVGMIHRGEIEIECGITTATWSRRKKADFSIPFFINGTRILTRRRFGEAVEGLAGKRIGVVTDSTTQHEVEVAVPKAIIVQVPDMSHGMAMFRAGQLDAISNIGVVLRGLLTPADDKGTLILLPRERAIEYEPIACMLPRDDSAWRTFVDRFIAGELDGATNYDGRYVEIYNRWFGPGAALPIPLDHQVVRRLTDAAYWIH